jgi:hypothetical protein
VLKRLADTEAEEKCSYDISVPSGWYEIEYGLFKGSGKGG